MRNNSISAKARWTTIHSRVWVSNCVSVGEALCMGVYVDPAFINDLALKDANPMPNLTSIVQINIFTFYFNRLN